MAPLMYSELVTALKQQFVCLITLLILIFIQRLKLENSNLRHRPIGLGVMGFQDALYKVEYAFSMHQKHLNLLMNYGKYFILCYYCVIMNWRKNVVPMNHIKVQNGIVDIFPQDTLALLEQERGMPIEVIASGNA